MQPAATRRAVHPRAAAAVDQRGVAGRARVGVHRLQRVDERAGDVLACRQHLKGSLRQVGERQRAVGRGRVADTGLNLAPPAVIRAREPHDPLPPGVVAREPHGLHHRLGSRHMERHLVEPGQRGDATRIVRDDRVIGTEHRPQLGRDRRPFRDRLFVELIPEQVDAVGAGQVDEPVAVEVDHLGPLRALQERARAELAPHLGAELERHPVRAGELQVGKERPRRHRRRQRARETLGVERGQPLEPRAAPGRDLGRRLVRREEPRLVIIIGRDQPRDALGEADMTGQRGVLGARQTHARAGEGGDRKRAEHGGTRRGEEKGLAHTPSHRARVTGV